MAIDYAVLKTELTTNPNAYSSGGRTLQDWYGIGSDNVCADILNQARAAISMPRADVNPQEILEAIRVQDFIASPNLLQGSWFESITQYPTVRLLKPDGTDTQTMTNFMKILVNASTSETRLRALASRQGSRAEQLFGVGTVLTSNDIYLARQSA